MQAPRWNDDHSPSDSFCIRRSANCLAISSSRGSSGAKSRAASMARSASPYCLRPKLALARPNQGSHREGIKSERALKCSSASLNRLALMQAFPASSKNFRFLTSRRTALLSGVVVRIQPDEPDHPGPRYTVTGKAADLSTDVTVVCRFDRSENLLIITAYMPSR